MVLIAEICRTIWGESIVAILGNCHSKIPNWAMLQNVECKLLAMKDNTTSQRKMRQLQGTLDNLMCIMLPLRPTRNVTTVNLDDHDTTT